MEWLCFSNYGMVDRSMVKWRVCKLHRVYWNSTCRPWYINSRYLPPLRISSFFWKVFHSDNSDEKCASHFRRQPANENKQLKETKTWISNSLIRQSFSGHCRALLSFYGGSLEIMLTVPLMSRKIILIFKIFRQVYSAVSSTSLRARCTRNLLIIF